MTAINPMTANAASLPQPDARQIAGYDVLRTLGTGAGSTLYLVNDRRGTSFALKHVVIKTKADRRFADQAIAEHAVAQRFDDPRIRKSLKVHKLRDLLALSGVAVLMEYVDGATLDDLPTIHPAQLYMVFREAAAALEVMHRAGYVHADIKPTNIMLTRAEGARGVSIKLIDFGQSCPINTVKQRIQGTPDYMAPEQAKRRAVDARTDIYCLAATMYNLLTGAKASRAFRPKGDVGKLVANTSDGDRRTPAHELNPDIAPAMSALLSDCLARRPDDRPATMTQVMDRLDLAIRQARRAS